MTKVNPFIRCVDYWPNKIPPECLAAYKALIDEGQITNQKVIYNKTEGSTVVSYDSNQPQEWVRQELKRRAKA